MSSVALQGNAGGSGAFVVTSPSSNNSRTLTLPDATTTIVGTDATQTLTNKTLTTPTLTTPTLTTPTIDSASVPTVSGTAPLYMARAWVNFNGTGTVAIRASGNVTDITDGGTGIYTVNFTTSMPDANYTAVGNTGGNSTTRELSFRFDTTAPTVSSAQLLTGNSSGVAADTTYAMVAIFR